MSDVFAVWYQPVIGALHVLGIAWFGAMLLVQDRSLRRWRWVGLALMLITGTLLFAANASHVAASWSFRIKLLVLLGLCFVQKPRWLVVGLWALAVFASRGIAYF